VLPSRVHGVITHRLNIRYENLVYICAQPGLDTLTSQGPCPSTGPVYGIIVHRATILYRKQEPIFILCLYSTAVYNNSVF
jgi:hypothetical protein